MPASSAARFPSHAASPPSAATHAATLAPCPPAESADPRAGVGAERERLVELHDHVEDEIAE